MAFDTLGLVTVTGKARIASMLATGKSFQITKFVIGDQGHLPADPSIALTPDPTITSYVYGNVLTKPVGAVTFPSATCPVWQCTVLPGDYSGPVSALYLIGTVVYDPLPGSPDLGLEFIFAVATRPRNIKGPTEQYDFEVGIFL
jgi:hypothetical protein